MEKNPKYEKYMRMSTILIISGIAIIIILGLTFLSLAISIEMENRCDFKYDCNTLDLEFQIPLADKNVILMEGELNFRSKYVFGVGNNIEYKIDLVTNNSDLIRSMIFVIGSEHDDFSEFEEMSIEDIIIISKKDGRLIDMQIQGNTLYRDGFWRWPLEEKLVVKPYITDNTGKLFPIKVSDVVADLKSFSEFKQAESNHLSNFSNFILLGLSFVGVGAIPLVLGAEIRFRINLRESEVNKWFSKEERRETENS